MLYLVEYGDDEGCVGKTLLGPGKPLNINEISDLIEEQLRQSNIDTRVVALTVEETNFLAGNIKHSLHELKLKFQSM